MLTNAILAALAETDPIARLDCDALRLPYLHGGVFKARTSTPHGRLPNMAAPAFGAEREPRSQVFSAHAGGVARIPANSETLPNFSIGRKHAGTLRPEVSADELFDTVQRQTLRYFWDFGHPTSGLARERSNATPHVVTTGGRGFGIMAILAGVERGWIARQAAWDRLITMYTFSARPSAITAPFLTGWTEKAAERYRSVSMTTGADIVETAYLMVGLLTARQYFQGRDSQGDLLAQHHRCPLAGCRMGLVRPRLRHALLALDSVHGWAMNHAINGWNECLITFVLAAAAPRHPIEPSVYHRGWTAGEAFANGRAFDGVPLHLGPDHGGPLFFGHYSFLGLDPRQAQRLLRPLLAAERRLYADQPGILHSQSREIRRL